MKEGEFQYSELPADKKEESWEIEFEPYTYSQDATQLIAETFAKGRQIDEQEITRRAQENEKKELTALQILRKNLGFLSGVGLLSFAISGGIINSGPQKSEQKDTSSTEGQKKYSIMSGRELSPAEAVAQEKISAMVGNEQLTEIELYNISTEASPKEREQKPPIVEGFDGLPSQQKILEATMQTTPPGFLSNVEVIRRDGVLRKMSGSYGMPDSYEAAHAKRDKGEILFSKSSESYTAWIFSDTLNHEICHLNDPRSNRFLDRTDRYRIYTSVLERVQAKDRYHSGYVEGINNSDKRIELERKAGEYWAEICGAYLAGYSTLPSADRILVRDMLSKTDPGLADETIEMMRMKKAQQIFELLPRIPLSPVEASKTP